MLRKRFIISLATATLIAAGSARITLCRQNQQTGTVFNSKVQENTAVRFFYEPPGNYFHVPIVFHAVEPEDRRLNTTPVDVQGRIAYISLNEMSLLLRVLARSNVSWQESKVIETMGSFKDIPVTESMVFWLSPQKVRPMQRYARQKYAKHLSRWILL